MTYTSLGGAGIVPAMAVKPRSSRIELAPVPAAVHHARRWADAQLARSEHALTADLMADAVLLVSELVTNAIRAVGPALPVKRRSPAACVSLTITTTRDTILLEVFDPARALVPTSYDPDDDEEGGRGLSVIAALSKVWGCRTAPGGKIVWCELSE